MAPSRPTHHPGNTSKYSVPCTEVQDFLENAALKGLGNLYADRKDGGILSPREKAEGVPGCCAGAPGAGVRGAATAPDERTNLTPFAPHVSIASPFLLRKSLDRSCPNDLRALLVAKDQGRAPPREEAGDKGLSLPSWASFQGQET